MEFRDIVQLLVAGVTLGSIYAIIALGFTIIYSVTGIINFAQGEFVMLGGMITFFLLKAFALPLWLTLVLAVMIVALVGFLVERTAIRPAHQASVITLIIITIGVSIFVRGVAGQLWGRDALPVPPFSDIPPYPFLGAFVEPQALWVVGTTLAVMLALHFFLSYSVLGKALRACAVNKRAVALMGIDERKMAAISFSLSAGLGAVGGIIMAPLTMTSYDVGVMLGLKGFVAASIGGFSSQLLAVAGGIGLGILEALSAGLISSAYKDATALVVLLIVLFIRAGRLAESERSA